MFTGIITDVAAIKHTQLSDDGLTITFSKPAKWKDLKLGESISTDGVCLTVAAIRNGEYDCLLVSETLEKSIFGSDVPARVNLERSMQAKDRFGGHFVQGHVDGIGIVTSINKTNGYTMSISYPKSFEVLVIPKGSICINGVSLTIAEAASNVFSVAVIPHTLQHTTLGELVEGDKVNLEFDVIGKYIVNIMEKREAHVKRRTS